MWVLDYIQNSNHSVVYNDDKRSVKSPQQTFLLLYVLKKTEQPTCSDFSFDFYNPELEMISSLNLN